MTCLLQRVIHTVPVLVQLKVVPDVIVRALLDTIWMVPLQVDENEVLQVLIPSNAYLVLLVRTCSLIP